MTWVETRRRWIIRAEEPKANKFATSRTEEQRRIARARAAQDRNIALMDDVAGDILDFVNEHNARVRAQHPDDNRDPGKFPIWTGED
jgi:hypothetical protein